MLRLVLTIAGIALAAVFAGMLADWAGYPPSGGAIGGAIGGLVGALMAGSGTRICQQCGSGLPGFRKPASLKQMLSGGWICPNCGTEVDRRGYPVH